MKLRFPWLFIVALSVGSAAWADDVRSTAKETAKQAVSEPAAPATYDVFIDGVSGYAFVRTPYGWKFVRSLRDEATPATKLVQR